MALDEFSVVLKAQAFVRKAQASAVPVPLEPYLKEVRATVREMNDMDPTEAGTCFSMADGSFRICVNVNDSKVRQRFTICHEIAHIVLGLKSDHATNPWSNARPLAERLCDLFAAQLLLPDRLFVPEAEDMLLGLSSIDALADRFQASVIATGSRFAESVSAPCAFVLSHQGVIVHAARSKAMKNAYALIDRSVPLPSGSLSARVCGGAAPCRAEANAADWFRDWEKGGVVQEESRHLAKWDRTLTLLWFESLEVPESPPAARRERRWETEGRDAPPEYRDAGDGEAALKELGTERRWPTNRRRR